MTQSEKLKKYTPLKVSLGRAMMQGDLIGRFYEIFMDSSKQIRTMFANTDMDKQKELLEHSLNLAVMFASGHPMGAQGILRIRVSHARNKRNINPEYYPYWKSSLLQALSEFDPEFDSVRKLWDEVLDITVQYIQEGYYEDC